MILPIMNGIVLDDKVRPFIETDAFIEEAANLKDETS